MHTNATACSIYETENGFGAIVAGDLGIVAHHLPFSGRRGEEALQRVRSLYPAAVRGTELTERGADLLRRYFGGERVTLDLSLDLEGFTPFQQRVYRFLAGIGYGEVISYGRVAEACGCPGGARAVGGVMARNPLPILIPCHRVVAANGGMTGFTAPGGIDSKRALLLLEGVSCTSRGVSIRTSKVRL